MDPKDRVSTPEDRGDGFQTHTLPGGHTGCYLDEHISLTRRIPLGRMTPLRRPHLYLRSSLPIVVLAPNGVLARLTRRWGDVASGQVLVAKGVVLMRLSRIGLVFLGLTMVACGSDAAPSTPTLAARAGIAPTPSPTQIVQPTATAAEVVPTAPTTTPVPTAIATPTPIPTPTRTPRPTPTPTRTPQPTHTPLPLNSVTLTLKCSDEWLNTAQSRYDRLQAIIDLSEDRRGEQNHQDIHGCSGD